MSNFNMHNNPRIYKSGKMAFYEKNICQKRKVPILNHLDHLAVRTTCFALDLACLKTRVLCQKNVKVKKKKKQLCS